MGATATVPIGGAIVRHDSLILGAALLLYSLSLLIRPAPERTSGHLRLRRLSSATLRVFVVVIATIYVLDILVYRFFGTRLYVTDVLLHRHEWRDGLGMILTFIRRSALKVGLLLLGSGLAAVLVWHFVTRPRSFSRRIALILATVALLGSSYRLLSSREFFINKPLFENFVERNWEFLTPKAYSRAFKKQLRGRYVAAQTCAPGLGQQPNFILLVVESLSAYQSRLFSGINDFTPSLDRIAREHTALTNFYANGWTSQGGAIALLTDALPIVPERAELNEWGSARINQFYAPNAIPSYLRGEGYRSFYFAAGSVTFLNQEAWLKRIGFDEVSGDQDPDYQGEPRGVLNSVADEVLYEKTLRTIATLPPEQHYFMMLATYRTHRPLQASNGARITEEQSFRQADRELQDFYMKLRRSGFFSNGVLMITGDHRAMEPFSEDETRRFGMSASARLPFVVVADQLKLPKVVDGTFQQHDLFASIRSVVSNRYCHDRWEGSFLSTAPLSASCVFHAKGESRDLVYVRCGTEEGIVYLNSDDTRFLEGNVSERESVLDRINMVRIDRGESEDST
jgi:lipoteichoic acid synthase